jgi:hypothetical protein
MVKNNTGWASLNFSTQISRWGCELTTGWACLTSMTRI